MRGIDKGTVSFLTAESEGLAKGRVIKSLEAMNGWA